MKKEFLVCSIYSTGSYNNNLAGKITLDCLGTFKERKDAENYLEKRCKDNIINFTYTIIELYSKN